MKKFLLGTGVAWLVVALVAGCAKKQETKYLVMGADAEAPPFQMRGGADGSAVVGFDVAVALAVAEKLGMPLKVVDLEPGDLLPALKEGRVDLLLSIGREPGEDLQDVDLSDPYYNAKQVVVMIAGDLVPMSQEDLKGRKIAVQQGTAGEKAALELTGKENVHAFPSELDAIVYLMNSQVQNVILDEEPAGPFLKKNPELMLAQVEFDEASCRMAVRKGDTELLAKVNETLAEIRADGRYDQFVEQWLLQRLAPTEPVETE